MTNFSIFLSFLSFFISAVADPDLQIRGGGGHLNHEIRGGDGLKKISVWSKNKVGEGGRAGPTGPSPGTANNLYTIMSVVPYMHSFNMCTFKE